LKPSSVKDDKLLLSQVALGNEKAFKVLFDRFSKKVYNKAFLILKNSVASEDVIQEVFIKFWINREKIGEINDLNAYLNVLTRNHVYNVLRKQAYHEKFIADLVSEGLIDDRSNDETHLVNDLHNRINYFISLLPPQQKRVYELSLSEGMKYGEIARQLGISRETVKKHISEALKKLKKHLTDYKKLIILLSIFRKT
jgi:RNA polymerase sigma-70 factor (family 1)